MDFKAYFRECIKRDVDRANLKVLKKPCPDCAVNTGFYLEFSKELQLEETPIQRAIAAKWFCHRLNNHSCRGNWDFLELDPLDDRSPVIFPKIPEKR